MGAQHLPGSRQPLLALVLLAGAAGYGQKEGAWQDWAVTYKEGKERYLENDWEGCLAGLESALAAHSSQTRVESGCKLECAGKPAPAPVVLHSPDLLPFEALIRETLCVMKCKRARLPGLQQQQRTNPAEKDAARAEFDSRKPYDYLQICYYQTGQLQRAAAAAFTHLAWNPGNRAARDNLQFYLDQPGVDGDKLADLTMPDYVATYLLGTDHYRAGRWAELVDTMESALQLYLRAEEVCRADCDKPFDMGWFPDFKSSVANHFTFCLKCKMNCAQNLNNFNGEQIENLVPSFYHYLQYGYYQSGQAGKAAQAAVTFLELLPGRQDMQANLQFYRTEGVAEHWYSPRQEAVRYKQRDEDEEALLSFIEDSFVFENTDLAAEDADNEDEENSVDDKV